MIHESVKIGSNVIIDGVKYDEFNGVSLRDTDIEIGENTVILNNVEIRKGTKIGSNCYIDSGVKFSGQCSIGNNVTLRYNTIIARGCEIGDNVYFAPNCMTNNLDVGRESIGGAKVGNDCFFGTGTVLNHGIKIAKGTKTGVYTFVNKDIIEENITCVGQPARSL